MYTKPPTVLNITLIALVFVLTLAMPASAITFNNEEIDAGLTDFKWCFDNPWEKDKLLEKEWFTLYQDNLNTQLIDAKLYVRVVSDQTVEVCKPKTTCVKNKVYNETLKKDIDIETCSLVDECKSEIIKTYDWFDIKKTDLLMKESDRFCYIGKRSPKLGFQAIDMNFIYDNGNELEKFDVKDYGKAWWNITYNNKIPIECDEVDDFMPLVLNGSDGFYINEKKSVVWTYCSGTGTSLYYNNESDFTIANDTTQLPFEVVEGDVNSYNPENVWLDSPQNYITAMHLDNSSATDSTGQHSATQDGSNPVGIVNLSFLSDANTEEVDFSSDISGSFRAISLNIWVYKSGNGGGIEDFWSTHTWAPEGNIRLFADNSGNAGFDCYNCGASTSSYAIPNNQWTMITYVQDQSGQNASLYINGTFATGVTDSDIGSMNIKIPGCIGRWCHDNNQWFNGRTDEAFAMNSTLTLDYINDTYQNFLGTENYGTLGESEQFVIQTSLDLGLYDEDWNNISTLINESQDFRVWANYSYLTNGSSISGGLCYLEMNETSQEIYLRNIGTNISVCTSGCDYTERSKDFDNLEQENYIYDILRFKLCRDTAQINREFTITTNYSASYTYSYSNIPNCDVGFANFNVIDANSSASGGLEINITTNGELARQLILVDDFIGVDRFHNHTQNMTYNNTLGVFVGDKREYYEHGTKKARVDCSSVSDGAQNQSKVLDIDVVNIPPSLFIDGISWWLLSNPVLFTDGISAKYPLVNGINISGGCSDNDLHSGGYYLNYSNNGTLIDTFTFLAQNNTIPSLVSFLQSNFSTEQSFLDGTNGYVFSGWCNDTTNNLTMESKSFTAENNPPVLTLDDSSPLVIGSIPRNISWSCTDDEGETTNNIVYLNGSINKSSTDQWYLFNESQGTYNITVNCGDSFWNVSDTLILTFSEQCSINLIGLVDGGRYSDNLINAGFNCTNSVPVTSCSYNINDYVGVTPVNCSNFNITAERGWNEFNLTVNPGLGNEVSQIINFWAKDYDASIFDYPVLWIMLFIMIACFLMGFKAPILHTIGGFIGIVVGMQLIAFSAMLGIIFAVVSPLLGLILAYSALRN